MAEVLGVSADPLLGQYELSRKQATTQRWTFAWHDDTDPDPEYVDFNDWDVYGEIRTKEKGGDVVISLTAHFTVADDDTGDGKYLVLLLPGNVDAALELPSNDGWFDIFLVDKTDVALDQLLVEGPVPFNPATTAMSEFES